VVSLASTHAVVQSSADDCVGLIEKHAVKHSPDRIEELVKIFIHATKMETGFWNMASTGV
jgi:thiaminase